MNGSRLLLAASLVLPGASACTRPPELAHGRFDLSAQPTLVRFAEPVLAQGTAWELCFEFDPPGDSHAAEHLAVVLLTTEGERKALSEVSLDRRGESVVCLEGRVGAEASAPPASVRYEAVELASAVPVRVRALRGGPRP